MGTKRTNQFINIKIGPKARCGLDLGPKVAYTGENFLVEFLDIINIKKIKSRHFSLQKMRFKSLLKRSIHQI